MTLKLRLNLTITFLLLIIMIMGGIFSFKNAQQNTIAEIKSAENLMLYFLDQAITNNLDLNAGKLNKQTFNLQRLTHMRHLKIELLSLQGKVIDSNKSNETNLKNTPPQWFIKFINRYTTQWQPMLKSLSYHDRPIGTLIIIPDPSYEYAEKWKQLVELFSLGVLFFVLVNIAVISTVAEALKPSEKILNALNELEQGNLETRLPAFKSPELSKIGDKFNHMIETLQGSIEENQLLAQKLISLQEAERKSLARDLHDEFGQCLTAIHTDAQVILNVSKNKYPELLQSAEAISQLSKYLIDIVRGLLQKLRPALIDELGLEATIQDLVEMWKARHACIECSLNIKTLPSQLSENIRITIYRMIQEALTNISKHAQAQHVSIELSHWRHRIKISIKDDGQGIHPKDMTGMGLIGMQERIESLKGNLTIHSTKKGTNISAWLPIHLKD